VATASPSKSIEVRVTDVRPGHSKIREKRAQSRKGEGGSRLKNPAQRDIISHTTTLRNISTLPQQPTFRLKDPERLSGLYLLLFDDFELVPHRAAYRFYYWLPGGDQRITCSL
jgi:hypothetical protein